MNNNTTDDTNDDEINGIEKVDEEQLLEEIFQRIRSGNDSKECDKYWEAAQYYVGVCELLQQLITIYKNRNSNIRIQQLYHDQMNDYIQQTRSCIINALRREHEKGTVDSTADTNATITGTDCDQDHQKQFDIITRYYQFVHPTLMLKTTETNQSSCLNRNEDEDTMMDDLEKRLQLLNTNGIPQHMKSEQQVLRERKEQLHRIGVFVHDTNDAARLRDDDLVSNILEATSSNFHRIADPVDEIIAQVTDEIQYEKSVLQHQGQYNIVESSNNNDYDADDTIDDYLINELLIQSEGTKDSVDDGVDSDKDLAHAALNTMSPSSSITKVMEQLQSVQDSISALQILLRKQEQRQPIEKSKDNSGIKEAVQRTEIESSADLITNHVATNIADDPATTNRDSGIPAQIMDVTTETTNASDQKDADKPQEEEQYDVADQHRQQLLLFQDIQRTLRGTYQQWRQLQSKERSFNNPLL